VPSIRVSFHSYELDLESGELWKEGLLVRLPPQPAKVLCLLVERAGELVTREEIQKTLWLSETFVDFDQGLNYCIRQIRVALEDSADQPRFVATSPRRGYRFIAAIGTVSNPRRLALAPRDAPPTPEISGTHDVQPQVVPKKPQRLFATLQRNHLIAGTISILILAGLIYYAGWHRKLVRAVVSAGSITSPMRTSGISPRTSVAVLGFANLDGKKEDAWLSTALSEMLSTELSEGGKLRLVSGEEIARVRPVVQLPQDLSTDTLGSLRRQLGADLIVLGSYAVLPQDHGNKIRLDLRLKNAQTGQTLAAFAQTGNEAELFDLISSAGTSLRHILGAGTLSVTQEATVDRSFPPDPDARRLYSEGLDHLRHSNALGARGLFEQVIQIDPRFAPAHAALASVWSTLGYAIKAREESKKAVNLASGLSREEQLSIEAQYYEMTQDRTRAVETLRALVSFFPDNIDYGIRLADVQFQGDQNGDALATLAKLRTLPGPLGTSPRLDILEAQILNHQGDFKKALSLSEDAVRKSRATGAQFMLAQSLITKAATLERLSSLDAAIETASEARQVATDAGFYRGVAISLLTSGNALDGKGDYDSARQRLESALSIFKEIGDKKDEGLALEQIGNSFHDQGKFAESQSEYLRAIEIYREIQWPNGISSATGNLANTLDALGDLNGSLKMHQETLQALEQIENKRAVASEINNIAFVQQEIGDLQAAAEGHRKALELHQKTGHQRGEMYAQGGLGDVFLLQGSLDAARKQYELARAIAEKTKEDDNVALFDIELATVDRLEQRLPEAETRARHSLAQFQKSNDPEGSAEAYALLVGVLLDEKKVAAADEAGRQAATCSAQITSLPPQFEVELALADIEAVTGKKDAARKRLMAVLDRTSHSGYVQYILEARRELIGLESGKSRSEHLSALSADARQKGFGLIVAESRR
jgi:eukaryotic-like serine/threonine-protein kinase